MLFDTFVESALGTSRHIRYEKKKTTENDFTEELLIQIV